MNILSQKGTLWKSLKKNIIKYENESWQADVQKVKNNLHTRKRNIDISKMNKYSRKNISELWIQAQKDTTHGLIRNQSDFNSLLAADPDPWPALKARAIAET